MPDRTPNAEPGVGNIKPVFLHELDHFISDQRLISLASFRLLYPDPKTYSHQLLSVTIPRLSLLEFKPPVDASSLYRAEGRFGLQTGDDQLA